MAAAGGMNPGAGVVGLIAEELLAFEFGIACEVFGLPRPEFGADWYRFGCAAVRPGTIRASGGLSVHIEPGLEAHCNLPTRRRHPGMRPRPACTTCRRAFQSEAHEVGCGLRTKPTGPLPTADLRLGPRVVGANV